MNLKLLILCLAFSPIPVLKAQQTGFGLGFIVGEPTGISFKYYLADDRAIAGAVAWRFWRGSAFHVHSDYLFHNRTLINVGKGSLPVFYGIGVRLRSWSGERYWHRGRYYDLSRPRVDLGVRFPLGLAYEFDGAPLDIFLEAVPILDLIPGTSFEVGGGLGMRYWF